MLCSDLSFKGQVFFVPPDVSFSTPGWHPAANEFPYYMMLQRSEKKGRIPMAEKRTIQKNETKGFSVQDLILVAVLLAAGAVLKLFVGSVINFFGMKPNFIIASYCLAILLVRPKLIECAIIGILAGAICQFLPGTPWLNFISELLGAVAMFFMIRVPFRFGKADLNPALATFVSTVISGGSFVVCLFLFMHMETSGLVAYVPIVLGTAAIGAVLVQALYIPLKKVLGR